MVVVVNSGAQPQPGQWPADLGSRAAEGFSVPLVVVDALPTAWTIAWVNDAFTSATGFARDDVAGRSADLLRMRLDDAEAVSDVVAAVQAERGCSTTLRLARADGSWFWARAEISPLRDESGTVTHWVGALVDVTQQVDERTADAARIDRARQETAGLELLSRVSDLLLDLDDPGVLREIALLLRQDLVGWAAFYLDDGGLRAVEGVDGGSAHGNGRHHGALPVDRATDRTAAGLDPVRELLDGDSDRLAVVSLELAEGAAGHPAGSASAWLAAHVRGRLATSQPDVTRVVVLPVPGRNRVLGVLVVVPRVQAEAPDAPGVPLRPDDAPEPPCPGPEGLDDASRTVLELTTRRVGTAVDNIRLYAREHRLAETLQRAMLPEQAEVDGLDVWSYYAPNVVYAQVGGDWYDVLQISDDVVGIVIGDVAGHDVEAAAAMGQLRSVVRAYAYEFTDPGTVLGRVDQLVGGMRIPRSAGLVLTTLTRQKSVDGGSDGAAPCWSIAYSRAGHLPALLVRAGEVRQLSGGGGSLIGFGRTERTTAREELRPGDVLVFYTDGLIERRDRALRDGVAALEAIAAGVGAIDAAGIGEELLAGLADHPEDDIAVVVVRVPDPRDSSGRAGNLRSRRWALPSEPSSIARARHAVVRACEAWELPDSASAELVVSELVANAVLHGWGHLALRLFDTGDGLRIEVEDSNPTPPVTTDGHPGRIGGFGMRIVERLADWGWRPARGGKLVWARMRADSSF